MKKKIFAYKLKKKKNQSPLKLSYNKHSYKKNLICYNNTVLRAKNRIVYKCLICSTYTVTKEIRSIKCYKINHIYDHPFGIKIPLNIPINSHNWMYQDENSLLKILIKKGNYDWEKTSRFSKFKNPIECESHYYKYSKKFYFEYYFLRGKLQFLLNLKNGTNIDNSNVLKKWDARFEEGFNSRLQRGEFLFEYRDSFEEIFKLINKKKKRKLTTESFNTYSLFKYNQNLYKREVKKKYKMKYFSIKNLFSKHFYIEISLKNSLDRLSFDKKKKKVTNFFKVLELNDDERFVFLVKEKYRYREYRKFLYTIFKNKYRINLKKKRNIFIEEIKKEPFLMIRKTNHFISNMLSAKEKFICQILGLKPFLYLKIRNNFAPIAFENCNVKKRNEYFFRSKKIKIFILHQLLYYFSESNFLILTDNRF
jgi:hypothetical protein